MNSAVEFEPIGTWYRLRKPFLLGVRSWIPTFKLDSPRGAVTPCTWVMEDGQGTLLVPEGYTWDGATGAVDTATTLRASMVHDVFCEAMAASLIPYDCWGEIALLYRTLAQEDGMSTVRAFNHFTAIMLHGHVSHGYAPARPRDELFPLRDH